MTPRFRNQCLGLLAVAIPLSACAKHEEASPSFAAATQSAHAPASTAPPVVSLPDFTGLVDQVGPAVVNIEGKITHHSRPGRSSMRGLPDDAQIPDLFRRFFGPDFQMPRTPDADSDDDGSTEALSEGSGFIIDSDGYILTNRHVVQGTSRVTVKLTDRRELTAKVIGTDEQFDVALVKIDAHNLPTVRIGDSDRLKPGQWVVAIGSPFGLDHSVTAGIVSAVGRSNPYADQRYVQFIQTDVAINQGNSGGPLINTRGEVVGINSQIFSASGGYMGISFAIPIDLAIKAADQIRATGHVHRGMLGVSVGPIDSLKAQALKLPDSRGALVNDMTQNSPAAKAGLEIGDVIRAVNGKDVLAFSDLPPLIGLLSPGAQVNLDVMHEGRLRHLKVTLAPLNETNDQQPVATSGEGRSVTPTYERLLGIQVRDLQENQADSHQGGGQEKGVVITKVIAPWARETQPPLTPGLMILRVGYSQIDSVASLNRALSGVKKGQVVMLLVSNGTNRSFIALRAGGGAP